MHGSGLYKWKDGRSYEGANYIYIYIYIYIGEYNMDKKEGQGVYTWADGRRYEGQWKNGKQNGYGKYIASDGKVRLGIWAAGKREKWVEGQQTDIAFQTATTKKDDEQTIQKNSSNQNNH